VNSYCNNKIWEKLIEYKSILSSGIRLADQFEKELEMIKKRRMEEIKMPKDLKANWPEEPVSIADKDFQSFIKKYPYVVVDCWAPWCGPCRMLGPVIDEVAKDYKGKIAFGKLNTDENQATAALFEIMSIPTLLFFKNGELVDRAVGAMPKQALESALKKHL